MCNCNKTGNTRCAGKESELQIVRNQLITLEKLATPEKVVEYKDVRSNIETLLKESGNTCPDAIIVSGLKNYIANEYAIYNN